MKAQQGDVCIERCKSIPKGAKKVNKTERGFVLAYGEVTGHAHVIKDDIEMYEVHGTLFIKTDSPCKIQHEEHGSITVDPGIYEIGIIKEYNPFEMEIGNVRD
jgi:hypothetical protein